MDAGAIAHLAQMILNHDAKLKVCNEQFSCFEMIFSQISFLQLLNFEKRIFQFKKRKQSIVTVVKINKETELEPLIKIVSLLI